MLRYISKLIRYFKDLSDTPASYSGQAGKHFKVNAAEDSVEYGTNTDSEIADAVTKKHTQGTDQYLDQGGVNEVAVADAKDAVDKKHSQNADTDLDPTFEATFVKKVDTVNELSDITSTGANIEDAVTKKHSQNTDTALGTQAQDLNMGTHKITGVVDPAAAQDVATKAYADSLSGGGPDKQNLNVKVNATNPTYQIDIDADYLQVQEYNLSSINLTADITSSGVNGLDTGAEAANTWYSIWVIYNPTTDTVAGLLSISQTSPTMPSGYTKKRRVGWVRNDGSSNFIAKMDLVEDKGFHDRGDPASYDFETGDFTFDNTWYDISFAAVAPPEATALRIEIRISDDTAGENFYLRKKGKTNSPHPTVSPQVANVALNTSTIKFCDSNQVMQYKGTGSFTALHLLIQGWWF